MSQAYSQRIPPLPGNAQPGNARQILHPQALPGINDASKGLGAVPNGNHTSGKNDAPGPKSRQRGVTGPGSLQDAVKIGAKQAVADDPITGKRFETLADYLWKLTPCKPHSIPLLERCYRDFLQVNQINKSSSEEQGEYNRQLAELMAKLESDKMKIIEAKGARRQVVQQNYDSKMKQLSAAREKQLSDLKNTVYKRYNDLVEAHKQKYVPAIANADKAFEYTKKVVEEFGIDRRKFPVQLGHKDVDAFSDPVVVANYARECAEAINAITEGSNETPRIIEKLNNLEDNKKKLLGGGLLMAAIVTAPVALVGGTALAVKQGMQEHQINAKIRELSYELSKCYSILRQLLVNLEDSKKINYPDKGPYDQEYERAYQAAVNSFKEQESVASGEYFQEMEKIKNEDISRAISQLEQQFEQNKAALNNKFSIKISQNGEIVSSKVRELYSVLRSFTESQDKPPIATFLKDKRLMAELVKACEEQVISAQKRSLENKILLFNNLELFESLQLSLIPKNSDDISDEFAFLEYNWKVYERILNMREDIRYIKQECMQNKSFLEKYPNSDDASIKAYLETQLEDATKQETELYMANTRGLVIGDDFLTEAVAMLPTTLAKIMAGRDTGLTGFTVRGAGIVNLQNSSVLCIYKSESEETIMANFVQALVYTILYNHHTESLVVNVINPNGNVLYDSIQISRDKISDKAQDKGKLIKGPDYVRAFVTKTDTEDLYKRLEINDRKLSLSSCGKTFNEVVREKRNTRGIVPRFTINVCVDVPIDGNYTRYLYGSDVKGVLNIVIQDKSALIQTSYESDRRRFKENLDMAYINYARQFQSIIEISQERVVTAGSAKNGVQSLFTISNRNYFTQRNILYTLQEKEDLNTIRQFLRERALASSSTSPETNEFIRNVVIKPALEARKKEQAKLNKQREMLIKNRKSIALNPGVPENRLTVLSGDDLNFASWYQDKIEREFKERCEKNPSGFFEMSVEETLPLYWGYVDGDRGKVIPIILDEVSKPHLFIGGTTGGGKSNNLACCVNTLKVAVNPEDVDVVYFDFKVAEVALHAKPYKMPQCSAMCGTYEPAYLVSLLQYIDKEMMRRYALISKYGVAKLSSLRKAQRRERDAVKLLIDKTTYKLENCDKLGLTEQDVKLLEDEHAQLWNDYHAIEVTPRMLFLVDEAAQGFQSEDDTVKQTIKYVFTRLAQLARAAGIHMCLLSQDADKFPSTIIDLLANRGCTVAGPAISKNILKNDFCARPENQFLGFMGFNCNNGNESDNVQYLVPYNDPENTTKVMSKVTDSLCKLLGIKPRDAVVFDEEEPYTYDRHNMYFTENPSALNGRDVYIGEGVYYQREFVPHMFSFRRDERNSLVIMSMDTKTRYNLVKAVCMSLQDNAVLIPCYAKEVPEGLGEEFFNVGKGKEGGFMALYGKEVGDVVALTQKRLDSVAEQMFPGDVWGEWDDIYNKESVVTEDGRNITLTDDIFKMCNEDSSMFNTVNWILSYRKDQVRQKASDGLGRCSFTPYYFIVFDLTKHSYVKEGGWSFWKDFAGLINEAARYDINFIFVDASSTYMDREIGGLFLASKIEALNSTVDRNLRNINPLFAKVYDIRNEYTAFVKIPIDGHNLKAARFKAHKELLDYIERTKVKFTEADRQKYIG